MGKHSTAPTRHNPSRRAGGMLLGAVATGALAMGSLGSPATANASCISFSGFNVGGGCTTSGIGDLAIVFGSGTAIAKGGLNTAIVFGAGSATADSAGNLNVALSVNGGTSTIAPKTGTGTTTAGFNLIAALGNKAVSTVGLTSDDGKGNASNASITNIVVAGPNSTATASGLYNIALANAGGGATPAKQGANAVVQTGATSTAKGNFNIAITRGQGSSATATGGKTSFPLRLINLGGNTAITIGNNSNSAAGDGSVDKLSQNLKFAAALGDNKNSTNPKTAAATSATSRNGASASRGR